MASEQEIKIPDIGGASQVDVIELLVQVGDHVAIDTPLITLESDKASMEIPSAAVGIVKALRVKVGDKVSEGDVILVLEADAATKVRAKTETKAEAETQIETKAEVATQAEMTAIPAAPSTAPFIFASPVVRRMAHELGVNLADVQGTGRKSRISKSDLQTYVKQRLQEKSAAVGGIALSAVPVIDFSQFGAIDIQPLSKLKRLTGVNVHRSWLTVPHVTHFDEADITALEEFRQSELKQAAINGYKLTILAFVCKVVVQALKVYPQFNASLDEAGQQLIYKRYYHLGIAVETSNGLVVPVIRQVDQLSIGDIAKEMARLSLKAREKGLMPVDMSGGCFTLSSLGGIGGTAFTPIVNAPEVAILGLSRASMKPVYDGSTFVPRLMLPLSLSYDHRVIDGAEAARFVRYVAEGLHDLRRIIL